MQFQNRKLQRIVFIFFLWQFAFEILFLADSDGINAKFSVERELSASVTDEVSEFIEK